METTVIPKKSISLHDITLGYNKIEPIIQDLSFAVHSNECFCIIGPNGSGKSTILYSLLNLVKLNKGSINIAFEKPVIAYLNQDYRQSNLLWASILDNLTYPLLFKSVPENQRNDIGREIMGNLLLEVEPNKKVYTLSGGQQQLISMGRALIAKPDIMICDEPLSAVDITLSLNALKQLEINRSQREFPILWVSHNIDEALLVSDKIGLLSKYSKRFYKIIDNPLPFPRKIEDLAATEMVLIKKEILDFLERETQNKNEK